MRRELVVKSSDHAPPTFGVIVLNKRDVCPKSRLKVEGIPGFHKKTPLISENGRFKDFDVRQSRVGDVNGHDRGLVRDLGMRKEKRREGRRFSAESAVYRLLFAEVACR